MHSGPSPSQFALLLTLDDTYGLSILMVVENNGHFFMIVYLGICLLGNSYFWDRTRRDKVRGIVGVWVLGSLSIALIESSSFVFEPVLRLRLISESFRLI